MQKIITIEKESQGQRLDAFLVGQLAPLSRSKIQKMIKDQQIKVNGKEATVHRFLKNKDEIEISQVAIEKNAIEIGDKKKKIGVAVKPTDNKLFADIKILADNDDYIIIEKPSGLLVHPTDKHEVNTLIDWASRKYPETAKVGDVLEFEGTIVLNKDFGAGYVYELIMESGVIRK